MADRVSHSRPRWELTVDPAKGYMATHGWFRKLTQTEGKMNELTVKPVEVLPGVWFPSESSTTIYYGPPDPNTGEQQGQRTTFTVVDLKLEPSIDPDHFTWKSLSLSPNTPFLRQDSDGNFSMGIVSNGRLAFGASVGKPVASN